MPKTDRVKTKQKKTLCILGVLLHCAAFAQTPEVTFEKPELSEVIAKAADAHKIVLIDVYTDWCEACKELDRTVFHDPRCVTFINDHFISMRVNAETGIGQRLTERYRLTEAYPTVLILDEKGVEIDRRVGLCSPAEFFETLDDCYNRRNTLAVLRERFARDKKNAALAIALGRKYTQRGQQEQALRHYRLALKTDAHRNDAALHFSCAVTLLNLQRFPEAKTEIDTAVRLDPKRASFKTFQAIIDEKLDQK